jgi:hypothetical protein
MALPTFTAGHEPSADEFAYLVPQVASKTANETVTNSATLQNDDALFLPVLATVDYALDAFVIFTSGGTPDFKFGWTTPTGAALRVTYTTYSLASPVGTQLVDSRTTIDTASAAVPGGGTTFTTQSAWIVIHGVYLAGGNAGTLQFQWAQNTADASNTTVYDGSWLRLTPLN